MLRLFSIISPWLEVFSLRPCVISDLKGEEIVGKFYEKELQKTNKKEFRIEKVIKRKDDKLYVKWKGQEFAPKSLGENIKVE